MANAGGVLRGRRSYPDWAMALTLSPSPVGEKRKWGKQKAEMVRRVLLSFSMRSMNDDLSVCVDKTVDEIRVAHSNATGSSGVADGLFEQLSIGRHRR
jgi:hypothetical protein